MNSMAVYPDNEPIENVVKDCAAKSTIHFKFVKELDNGSCKRCTMGELIQSVHSHHVTDTKAGDVLRKIFGPEFHILVDQSVGEVELESWVDGIPPQKQPEFVENLTHALLKRGIRTFKDLRYAVGI